MQNNCICYVVSYFLTAWQELQGIETLGVEHRWMVEQKELLRANCRFSPTNVFFIYPVWVCLASLYASNVFIGGIILGGSICKKLEESRKLHLVWNEEE